MMQSDTRCLDVKEHKVKIVMQIFPEQESLRDDVEENGHGGFYGLNVGG